MREQEQEYSRVWASNVQKYGTESYVRRKVDMSCCLDFLCFRCGGSLTLGSIVLVFLFLLVTGARSSSVFFLRTGLSVSGRCLTLFSPSPFLLPPCPPSPLLKPAPDEVQFSVLMGRIVVACLLCVRVGHVKRCVWVASYGVAGQSGVGGPLEVGVLKG